MIKTGYLDFRESRGLMQRTWEINPMQGWSEAVLYIYMTPLFENKLGAGLKTFIDKFTDPD